MRRILLGLALLLAAVTASLYVIGRGWVGDLMTAGTIEGAALPAKSLEDRDTRTSGALETLGLDTNEQVLFGDLHVHSGFSLDAYIGTLPLVGGTGAYSVADACDFARYCSGLDFWSINDHAGNLTPRRWLETIDSVRECDARGTSDGGSSMIAFLGWEWTQMGDTPANHFGHKNVVLHHLDDARIPTRPIAAESPTDYFRTPPPFAVGAIFVAAGGGRAYLDLATMLNESSGVARCAKGVPVRDLPDDCMEFAATPRDLFDKLDDWGHDSIVIPHGTTWGNYTPPGSNFAKQLQNGNHDPARQRLVEVYSGHGSAEEYRSFRAVRSGEHGESICPEPTAEYLPSCWQAGEIIRARCLAENESAETCEDRAVVARANFLAAPGGTGHLAVGDWESSEWLDAGQCRDCFLPAFNHRPASSVQAMLAARSTPVSGNDSATAAATATAGESPSAPEGADRFRFGLIGSSDTHTARAGSGYKEVARVDMTDARLSQLRLGGSTSKTLPSRSEPVDLANRSALDRAERARLGSYFLTGGLVAVHAPDRSRDGVWDALMARHVYGTSGPRILLFFELVDAQEDGRVLARMGDEISTEKNPRFRVRAAGSFEQLPGCPDASVDGLSADRLERLCRGECANPGETRRPITRIEVVRIRPRTDSNESLEELIENPWLTLPCSGDPAGCSVEFEDASFGEDARDTVYYVRAIEAPAPTINGGGLRCLRDELGACIEPRPCDGVPDSDDCLEEVEPRAWSSPIFVDYRLDDRAHGPVERAGEQDPSAL